MPLYLEPENLRNFYPEEIVSAFSAIKVEIGTAAITPRIALNLIRKHFLPLDPIWIDDALSIRKEVDWNTVEFVGIYLIKEGYARGEESALAYAIHDFFNYCRKPRRTAERLNPDHVLANCKLCWRHPVTYKNYCYFHHPDINNSNYKHALRKKEEFSEVHNELVIGEHKESDTTNSTYKLFFPRENQKAWLQNVRPNVWKFVAPRISNCPDSEFLSHLLRELDWFDEESPSQKQRRKKIHDEILVDPHLISTMLGLAEAWIIIEQQRNDSHGGKRVNSGRKAKPKLSA
jgi:hypothetical protein